MHWFVLTTAISCAAFLALAVLAASRGSREPLAARLAELCVALFAYDAFDLVAVIAPTQPAWDWLDAASAAMCAPTFFHFTITFLGQRRERAKWIRLCFAYFGALALASLSPVLVARMAPFPGGALWATFMLGGMLPMALVGGALLVRHARTATPEERARTTLVLGCVALALAGTATDLTMAMAGQTPTHFASWALVGAAVLLLITAFRTRALARVSVLVAINTATVAGVVVLSELALFSWLGSRTALLAVSSAILIVLALWAGRFLYGPVAERAERARGDITLGRMSRQMAHDLRNPLAAIRGAAQFLQAEKQAGRSLDAQLEFVDLIAEQSERMARVIEQYHRLGRVEPKLAELDLREIVGSAAGTSQADVDVRLDADLPRFRGDSDLLVIALENLVANARSALRDGGRIRILGVCRAGEMAITVEDDGAGMDPRTRERALEGFFTTKAEGSGLGLAFVRRVAEAHAGRLVVSSEEGKGTRVVIELPVR